MWSPNVDFQAQKALRENKEKKSMHHFKDVINEDPFDKLESVIYFHAKKEMKRKIGSKQGTNCNIKENERKGGINIIIQPPTIWDRKFPFY